MGDPRWKIIASINVVLGVVLWFGYLTDYSWAGALLDILFPPFVGAVSLFSLIFVVIEKGTSGKTKKAVGSLACIPSLLGGCLSVLSVILMLIPPFTMGFIFMMTEIGEEVLIQQAVSPDGLRVAEVYFTPVGAYGSGNGRISVQVKPRLFPVVERDVFSLNASYADENTSNYLSWVDNETLYISEVQEELRVGRVGLELSPAIAVPINLFRYYQSRSMEQKLTAPVSDVPIFVGDVRADHSRYAGELDTVLRAYDIWDHTPDELAEWHQQVLSEPPWSVVQVNRDVIKESGAIYTEYCIQAQRSEEGETRIYFWEIKGWDRNTLVNVRIGTPKPVTDTCLRHLDQP